MGVILPRYLALEVTRACNYGCPHCGVDAGTALDKELSREEIFSLIGRAKPDYLAITGGEPLLREDIFDIINYGRRFGVVRLNTNGSLLDRNAAEKLNANQVFISLDALPGGRSAPRGAENFAHVTAALDSLEAAGKLRRAMICMTVSKDNPEEPERIIRHFSPRIRNFGISRLAPIGRAGADRVLSRLETARLYARLQTLRLKNFIFFSYEFGAFLKLATSDLTVLADGSLVPCCIYRKPFGNIRTAKRLPWFPRTCLLFMSGCPECRYLRR